MSSEDLQLRSRRKAGKVESWHTPRKGRMRPDNFTDEALAATMHARSDDWLADIQVQARLDIETIDRELVLTAQDCMHRRRQCERTIDAVSAEQRDRQEGKF